jgi:hypothetical protein
MGAIAAANKSKYKYLDDGRPDGVVLGQSATKKVGFYGFVPVAQQEVPADAADVSTTTWNATARTEINAINTNLKDLVAELVEMGLISQA